MEVPAELGFAGQWNKVDSGCTPNPLPVDSLIDASWLTIKAHEAITGIVVTETPTKFTMKARVKLYGLPTPTVYQETYYKDGSACVNPLRRDLRAGTTRTHLYFTDDGSIVAW